MSGFLPPPGLRNRSGSSSGSRSSSLIPAWMVVLDIPVASATRAMPPRPIARASAAAQRRRVRSSSKGLSATNLACTICVTACSMTWNITYPHEKTTILFCRNSLTYVDDFLKFRSRNPVFRGAALKLPNRKISKRLILSNYPDPVRGASRANDFVTKRRSGRGFWHGGKKECSWRTAEMLARTHNPMPVSQSRFVPLETFPGSRRGSADFCVHRREGGRDCQGGVRNLRQGRGQTEGRVRRFRGRASGSLRCAGWCKYAGTRGAARFARTARFGPRGRRRPTLSGLPDAQGLVLAGRQWADGRAAALLVLNHCAPREAAKLFGELGGMNPSSSHALVRRAVSGRKGSRRPWTAFARRKPAKPFPVLSRSTGFRFAPTGTKKHAGRPAGRSVSRTRKAENAQFWVGSRRGNVEGATRRRDRSRPQGAARTGCRRRRRA